MTATQKIQGKVVSAATASAKPNAFPVPKSQPTKSEKNKAEKDPLLNNIVLDKYRIIGKIGEGSFGKVYQANDRLNANMKVNRLTLF